MEKMEKFGGFNTLFVGEKKPANPNSKLLVVMHGLGDSIEGYRFLPELLRIPNLNYCLINAPDPYFTGYSWFDIYGDIEKGVWRSRDLLIGLLDELQENGWKPADIGLFGFSQGCLMALDVACRYQHVLGAIVGVSGFVAFLREYPEKLSPAATKQKILVTHGSADQMLPIQQSKAQMLALKGMGLQLEWREYMKDHTIEPRQEVADIRSFIVKNLMR